MLQTVEATIDEQGNVRLLEPIQLPKPRRAFVTILPSESEISETALLSEAALAQDWNRPEEDMAWSHLQQVQSSWCLFHRVGRVVDGQLHLRQRVAELPHQEIPFIGIDQRRP